VEWGVDGQWRGGFDVLLLTERNDAVPMGRFRWELEAREFHCVVFLAGGMRRGMFDDLLIEDPLMLGSGNATV
jgi:hypothetical protein